MSLNFTKFFKTPFIKIEIFIKSKIFSHKNKLYLKEATKQTKKRLILTTGNISLINSIAALKQKNNSNEYEDYLYIWSINKNPEFKECCKQIASLYPFKKIYFFEDYLKKQLIDFVISDHKNFTIKHLIKLNLFDIDEIFAVNIILFLKLLKKLFPNTPYYILEESAFGTFSRSDYDNVREFIMPTYLGKIDNIGFSEKNKKKFVELDKNLFIEIADKCAKMCPLNIENKTEDKIIIFCGTWGDIEQYKEKEVFKKEQEIIKKLQDIGYIIYFKPHPRDLHNYIETDNFKILNSRLPLECYKFENIIATVSLLSYSSLQSYHYRKLPSFICLNYFKNLTFNKSLALLNEYTPSVDLILNINPKEYSSNELREKFTEIYLDFINKKPMLSQNRAILRLFIK